MSGFIGPLSAAPAGSTGNNTHASVKASPAANKTALSVIVEAVGGTPTLTYKWQGSMDPDAIADASAQWQDLALLPAGSDTVTAAPAAVTAVGVATLFLAQSATRFFRRYRLVTSLNTNVTYRGEIHQQYTN